METFDVICHKCGQLNNVSIESLTELGDDLITQCSKCGFCSSIELSAKSADSSETTATSRNIETVLHEAIDLVNGDRQNQYGPPEQDFARTASMWTAILGTEVQPRDVALCMIALKISRATWQDKRDNWVDIAGYAECGNRCMEAETE